MNKKPRTVRWIDEYGYWYVAVKGLNTEEIRAVHVIAAARNLTVGQLVASIVREQIAPLLTNDSIKTLQSQYGNLTVP